MAAQAQKIVGSDRILKVQTDVGEELLAVAYLRMQQEGLLSMFFWEKAPTLRAFLDWCAKPESVVVGVFLETIAPTLDEPPKVELCGLGCIHSIRSMGGKRHGDTSEVFFREFQSIGITGDAGQALLEFAFTKCNMDAIYGVTPSKNLAAVRFMRWMGFTAFGPIPELCCWNGENCDGWISVLTRSAWLGRSGK